VIERLLIVGLGSIGRRHLRLARELMPGIRIVVLRHRSSTDPLPDGIERCVTTIDDAVAFAPQAAVIASPSPMHVDVALALAGAGVPLLVEKPISNRVDGVEDLIAHCREKNIVLMTGYNLRFSSSLQRFRNLLNESIVGEVHSVRAEVGQYLPDWRPASDYRTTVSAQAALGGGVLLELSHEIDYLRWLFGEVDAVSALVEKRSNLEIDVEDTALLTLRFASAAGGRQLTAALQMDFIRRDTTRRCTAIGETGSLRWDGVAGVVELYDSDTRAWKTVFQGNDHPDDTYRREWRAFLAAVQDDVAAPITGDDGLAVLRVIDAARRSASSQSAAAVVETRQGINVH
jgi:predicted dehydrogenase